MTAESNNTKPESSTEPSDHVITAIEAYWVETQLGYDPDSDSPGDITILHDDSIQAVSNTRHAWDYECSCGSTFTDVEEAKDHLRETADV